MKNILLKLNPEREYTSAILSTLCHTLFFSPRKEELLTRVIKIKLLICPPLKSRRIPKEGREEEREGGRRQGRKKKFCACKTGA